MHKIFQKKWSEIGAIAELENVKLTMKTMGPTLI